MQYATYRWYFLYVLAEHFHSVKGKFISANKHFALENMFLNTGWEELTQLNFGLMITMILITLVHVAFTSANPVEQ